ncbi:PIH1 domain-containing protein 2 isoform X2 [Hypanus sabinus]|uniref:PIH1 domain-containing protein 2 isoform X2 n=1 Tax=Hypanus sabinus TaxID=79690 RepID=UPI0028C3C709|nr:PIH1 domain-containing protein 2 isoform X2 [Hypanus sabinus]
MAGKRREEVLLQQVNQLWSTLDEMSETNPEDYRRFIRQQLGEGVKQLAAPVPHSCFQTRITEPGERLLYVNLCGWARLPAPKSDSEPVPLAGGTLETADGTDSSSVTDVAYSPEVLRKASEDPVERDQLVRLAMKYVEEQHRLHLTGSYRLLPGKLHGSVERLRRRLTGRWGPEREAEAPPIRLPGDAGLPSKPGLIQEISSTEFEPGDGVRTPAYDMSTVKDENGGARSLQLKVQLPGVSSVEECDLSVSEAQAPPPVATD